MDILHFGFFRSAFVFPIFVMIGAAPTDNITTVRSVPEPLVAEAPIWGANNAQQGYAFLPVTLQGHAATLVIDLNCTRCDVTLSTAALARIGITIPDPNATTLPELTVGTDVQHDVPIQVDSQPGWAVSGPDKIPEIIGAVGVHFLTTHYDLLYDFPRRRVRLYAISPKPVASQKAWLPDGFKPTDCGRMITIPPGAGTFTGVAMKIDGHPVTGVFEMGPYYPKMNQNAVVAMGLTKTSPRVQPIPDGTLSPGYSHNGYPITQQIPDVHMTIGEHMFWTGRVQIFPVLDVESLLSPKTPVMLLNLSMLRNVMLFNAVSSRQVCVAKP